MCMHRRTHTNTHKHTQTRSASRPRVPQWTEPPALVWGGGNDSRVTHTHQRHETVTQRLPKKELMIRPVGIGPNLLLSASSELSAEWQTVRITLRQKQANDSDEAFM